jgi:hypothetical protein
MLQNIDPCGRLTDLKDRAVREIRRPNPSRGAPNWASARKTASLFSRLG